MPTKVSRPKRYHCSYPDCEKSYNRPILLRQHENSHTNERPFKCTEPGCDKAFFKKSNLDDHSYSHKPMSERPFACNVCPKKFISLDRLRNHELIHTDRFKCTRDGCDRAFASRHGLKHHINVFHDRVLTCDLCNRNFGLPRLVQQHRLKVHSEASAYPCSVNGCYSIFANEAKLVAHVQEKHPESECPICKETFVGPESLAIHMSVHNGDATLLSQCGICGDKFVNKADLTNHSRKVHGSELADSVSGSALDLYLAKSENPSLHGFTRGGDQRVQVIADESSRPKTRGRKKIVKSLPAPKSGSSVISIVTQATRKDVHVCPFENCHKTYVRRFFYDRHLQIHHGLIDNPEKMNNSDVTTTNDTFQDLYSSV